ncbi:MAG: hypothetical protein WDN45_14805 [Caulobacteraceae bacterium]
MAQGRRHDAAEVLAAAQDCALIVHAVNPPGYRRLGQARPADDGQHHRRGQGHGRPRAPAGTIYNYGPDAFPVLREDAAQRPVTRKGKIRVAMEQRLKDSGVPALVVRAGDFFGGPEGRSSWFAQACQAGRGADRRQPPRTARRRPRLGLSARPGRDDGRASRQDRRRRLPALPFRRPLRPRRRGHDLGHRQGRRTQAQGRRLPHGSRSSCSRPSSPCSARCGRCATCGASLCASTTPAGGRARP